MSVTSQKRPQDVPSILAVTGLVLVVGGYLYLGSPTTFFRLYARLDRYVDLHAIFLAVVAFVAAVNGTWLYSIAARAFGQNQQGSKLGILTGRRPGGQRFSIKVLGASCGIAGLAFLGMLVARFPGQAELSPLPLSLVASRWIIASLRANFCLAVLITTTAMGRFSWWKLLRRHFRPGLPEMPCPPNGIVLGSTGDDDRNGKPKWITLNRRALNGNILITGSIGGGKTQGTILPFLDQILTNFKVRPAILAIDPKGTFIPEALRIIEKHGMSEHVLRMKLGGNITFNPIFNKSPLKGAHFLDTAQMIRAAAVNFMGKSFDSPFWEISAFNLIKSCLVLCAARFYSTASGFADFGLIELYQEMVGASKDSKATASLLRQLAGEKSFDDEEKFNIECAANYFDEYGQLDEKVKTGILATSTAFLNQFQEYQASRIFCPKQMDATIKSMDDVVDNGKILLFDVASPALARSMGTFIKLHFQQSVLNRLQDPSRGVERTAIIIADEYQDVVSTGAGMTIGDDRYCAKNREANGIAICATQSLTSLKNSIGKEDAARELFQNFRTIIAGHSADVATIRNFQELVGQEERDRVSHSVSENARHPSRNLMLGGFETDDSNISESVSTSPQKEYTVTGKEFSRLETFETLALIYDGVRTKFTKLFLKPYFLPKKNVLHSKVLEKLASLSTLVIGVVFIAVSSPPSQAFPNVCTVVKTSEFMSCLGFSVGACVCAGIPPRPCANFSYYVPETFVEVFPDSKSSYFSDLPGAAVQLKSLNGIRPPFGAEADTDTQSFQAHVLGVPLISIPFSALPCGPAINDRLCFEGMSEELGSHWSTGASDALQPIMQAWSLSPKACLVKGAVTSIAGESEASVYPGTHACGVPMDWMPTFPPSNHSACNGWGTFYPRSGVYNGLSQTAGALMIASRIKSLGTEVFHSSVSSSDELWQMITPQSSSCFREGQNVAALETFKNARETGRLTSGKLSGYLFTVWSKVSCCKDLGEIPAAAIAIEATSLVCQGLGAL